MTIQSTVLAAPVARSGIDHAGDGSSFPLADDRGIGDRRSLGERYASTGFCYLFHRPAELRQGSHDLQTALRCHSSNEDGTRPVTIPRRRRRAAAPLEANSDVSREHRNLNRAAHCRLMWRAFILARSPDGHRSFPLRILRHTTTHSASRSANSWRRTARIHRSACGDTGRGVRDARPQRPLCQWRTVTGLLENFTGVNRPAYELPAAPDLRIDTRMNHIAPIRQLSKSCWKIERTCGYIRITRSVTFGDRR